MGRNLIETIMGAVVLVVAIFLLVFAYSHADLKETKGNAVVAQFANVAGLDRGGDVRINGIKIGTISALVLDPQTFTSVVTMSIRSDIALPTDSTGAISSDGLLGAKYIRIEPGRSKDKIAPGGSLAGTTDYKSLEELVGNLIFLATSDTPKAETEKPAVEKGGAEPVQTPAADTPK